MNKKSITWLFLFPLLVMFSCTNLDDIKSRLDDHDRRLENLESLTKNANASIQDLQKIVNALEKNVSVVKFEASKDGSGYVLTMSDGNTITLKHGTNGKTPAMGVEEIDGVLYWTIDGKQIYDANGQPVKAEGKDGSDGMAPSMRVDSEGYWEISVDGGKTWSRIKDADNQPVKAIGNGESDLKIYTEGDNVIIIYKGNRYVLPKGETPDPGENRPMLAIDYVAEYNVNAAGDAFVTSHANDGTTLYSFAEAKERFIKNKLVVDGKKYHVPNQKEWRGIIPDFNGGNNVRFNGFSEGITKDYQEEIEIAGVVKTYTADYMPIDNNTTCALRFKDNEDNSQRSAYRYELITNPESPDGKLLKITVKYIGNNTVLKIEDIADETYWADTKTAVVRFFPASGYERNGEVNGLGTYGRFWSADSPEDNRVFCAIFNANIAASDMKYYGTDKSSVRLFETTAAQ